MKPVVLPLGDSAITVALADASGNEATDRTRVVAELIRRANVPHVEEVVAAYTAVTVFYDSLHASFEQVSSELVKLLGNPPSATALKLESRQHSIPVSYDGPDLDSVANATGLDRSEVIALHSSRVYTVDLLGFVPGFAYLSELDERLELPRREQPRPRVPAGSVAIAARLTGIYPFDTPGGWHLIGRTTSVMFDPRRPQPSLFKPGDTVKFEPDR